jgi:hypothetical protein
MTKEFYLRVYDSFWHFHIPQRTVLPSEIPIYMQLISSTSYHLLWRLWWHWFSKLACYNFVSIKKSQFCWKLSISTFCVEWLLDYFTVMFQLQSLYSIKGDWKMVMNGEQTNLNVGSHCLFKGTIQTFVWRDWGTLWITITCLRCEQVTSHIQV